MRRVAIASVVVVMVAAACTRQVVRERVVEVEVTPTPEPTPTGVEEPEPSPPPPPPPPPVYKRLNVSDFYDSVLVRQKVVLPAYLCVWDALPTRNEVTYWQEFIRDIVKRVLARAKFDPVYGYRMDPGSVAWHAMARGVEAFIQSFIHDTEAEILFDSLRYQGRYGELRARRECLYTLIPSSDI